MRKEIFKCDRAIRYFELQIYVIIYWALSFSFLTFSPILLTLINFYALKSFYQLLFALNYYLNKRTVYTIPKVVLCTIQIVMVALNCLSNNILQRIFVTIMARILLYMDQYTSSWYGSACLWGATVASNDLLLVTPVILFMTASDELSDEALLYVQDEAFLISNLDKKNSSSLGLK